LGPRSGRAILFIKAGMLDKLLRALAEVTNVREHRGKQIIKNATEVAHNDKAKIGIWWYHILDKKLEYSEKAKAHPDSEHFPTANSGPGWVRGRVLKYDDKAYVIVYLEPWPAKEVSGRTIADIFNQITDTASVKIHGIVDEEGFDLLGI
jgi:hypothetical protein